MLNEAQYEADLRDDSLSIRQVAQKHSTTFNKVQRARKALKVTHSPASPGAPVFKGSSDPRNGKSYELTALEPWGESHWRDWLKENGTDPDKVSFSFGVTTNPQGGYWNKLNNVKPLPGMADMEATFSLSEARKRASQLVPAVKPTASTEEHFVVVLADFQIGKTGRRGGTPELINRIAAVKEAVLEELRVYPRPEGITLFDLGDMIEGFESGGNPMFTNDLSLADQLDLYATVLLEFIQELDAFAPVTVAGVCSNHAAWRRGRQTLGRPSDDFGIFVHKQVQKMCEMADMDVKFNYPDEYDESICIDVGGTRIGAVHGNQFGQGKAIDWWEGQAFGAQAVSSADVLLTGHYHTFGAGVAGINPVSGRERMWLGAPTLDSGSDWYRNVKGRDSKPGLMTFWVGQDGFDLSSLRLV